MNLCWTLFSPGDCVLVAVSGGPDSLSLLHALSVGQEAHRLQSIQAAHLDHGLRGEESAADAVWVAEWCAARNIPCHLGFADVGQIARQRKRSKQEAARAARYEFLEATAAAVGASKVATAHTQDDQSETVLLNILRGTGLDGLQGIPARRGPYIRPLLGVSRPEIEAYCLEQELTPRRDPSNLSEETYTRNRVRLQLLPQIARDYNPAISQALLRLSEIAARDSDYLHGQASAALTALTQERDACRLVLDRFGLARQHPALIRYILRAAIAQTRGSREGVTYAHLEAACRALEMDSSSAFSLSLTHPACTVQVTKDAVILALPPVCRVPLLLSTPLPFHGSAALPEIGWSVVAHTERTEGYVAVDADALRGTLLIVRTWQAGDKIDPVGMGGHHKKVSDIFTNAKVPRAERSTVPIVADDRSIIWVAGYALSERVKVTAATTRVIFLTAERLF